MKFRKRDRIAEESGVLLAQPLQRRQIRTFRRRNIPLGPDLREGMLCCRSPENVFAAIMVSDQGMLEAEPVRYGANARSFESSFGKFRDSGIEDRGSCRKRALLLGSRARAVLPLSSRCQPRFLRH